MKLYRKYVQMVSFGHDDYTNGTIICDWIPEEQFDINNYTYEYTYIIKEKYVEVTYT